MHPGFQIKPFEKTGRPSPFSEADMNLLVQVLNAFLRLRIVRGEQDKVLISDNNVVLQISGRSGSGGAGGDTFTLTNCVTGKEYTVYGYENPPA